MSTVAPTNPVSVEEYLARERAAEDKNILWDGEIFAMAGASLVHNRLVASVLRALGNALDGKPCVPLASDQRVRLASARYVYPGATVACPPFMFAAEDDLTITNPKVVFEVLSPTAEAFDRGAKFLAYRGVPSIADVVLLSPETVQVEHYHREGDGSWRLRTLGAGEMLELSVIEVSIEVGAMYGEILKAEA